MKPSTLIAIKNRRAEGEYNPRVIGPGDNPDWDAVREDLAAVNDHRGAIGSYAMELMEGGTLITVEALGEVDGDDVLELLEDLIDEEDMIDIRFIIHGERLALRDQMDVSLLLSSLNFLGSGSTISIEFPQDFDADLIDQVQTQLEELLSQGEAGFVEFA